MKTGNRQPIMYVCPRCGPTHVMFAGKVISRLCEECRKDASGEWSK